MRNFIIAITLLMLLGCGAEHCEGLDVDAPMTFYSDNPVGNLILHAGHAGWTCDMTVAAYGFVEHGFTVHRAEMPLSPHGPESDYFGDVLSLLNRIEGEVYMVGLSGGGWTTTMITAMDARITKGYSVAGDHPVLSYAQGDWEQQNPPMAYHDAYSVAGDRLLHIYNWNDSCCFAKVEGDIGAPYVTDYTAPSHIISAWTVNYIAEDILQ